MKTKQIVHLVYIHEQSILVHILHLSSRISCYFNSIYFYDKCLQSSDSMQLFYPNSIKQMQKGDPEFVQNVTQKSSQRFAELEMHRNCNCSSRLYRLLSNFMLHALEGFPINNRFMSFGCTTYSCSKGHAEAMSNKNANPKPVQALGSPFQLLDESYSA